MKITFSWLSLVAAAALLCGTQSPIAAATYTFDITPYVDSHFAGPLENTIDLNTQFQAIDSATLQVSGTFTPGLVTMVGPPGQSNPIVSSDTFSIVARLGDEGTSFIDKHVAAYHDFHDSSGPVNLVLPLLGSPADMEGLPVFPLAGNGPADFNFLLDGRFAITAGGVDLLAAIYQEVQAPQFEVSKVVLEVNGTGVPEPSTLALAVAAPAALAVRRRRRPGR